MSKKIQLATRFHNQPPSIWVQINKIVSREQAVNLGQGFPDYPPPSHVTDELAKVAKSDNFLLHQYTRAFGHPRMVNALSKLYAPQYGREVDPLNEIIVSVGAYGSLATTVNALVNPGEEVIIVEPFFDCYAPLVNGVLGKPVYIPLRPPKTKGRLSSADWKLDPEELKRCFTSKTKMIILNTPNNPMGKVFTREELQMVADLCIKHDVICVSDEVYEWMIFEKNQHIKIATLPGMWERTLTIGSAGKTFSVTGWKLGWTIGPEDLIKCLQVVHQNAVYTCPTPLQEAVAAGLEHEIQRLGTEKSYFSELTRELVLKRDMLAKELEEIGMVPTIPEGGYFMLADISSFDVPDDGTLDPEFANAAKDVKFNTWMVTNKKLAAIPPSVFYSADNRPLGENYLRFCYIKKDETLAKAVAILKEWRKEVKT